MKRQNHYLLRLGHTKASQLTVTGVALSLHLVDTSPHVVQLRRRLCFAALAAPSCLLCIALRLLLKKKQHSVV